MILYEFPFNESLRTMLRLEHLFDRLGQLIVRHDSLDHHFALVTLFEIMDVASRADLKSDLLKELERYRAQFQALRGNPAIEEATLLQVLSRIEQAHSRLNELQGKAGQALSGNDWLMSVRSRISIPGGTCEFDLPAYYAWQKGSVERRQRDLHLWVTTLMPLAEALQLLMGLLRDAGQAHMVVARQGLYQQSLPASKTYQLLRLRVDETLGLVPEISGHRLMVTVRLMREGEDGHLKPALEDASFELALCA